MAKSDIVFGSEFSPAVIDLPKLLNLVARFQPDRAALQSAIDNQFFSGKGKNADPRKTLGDNTILSLIAYGILSRKDKDVVHLTEFGQELYENQNDDKALRSLIGRHCLAHLDGLRVISSIQDLIQAKIPLKKESLAKRLREEGLHVLKNGKHLNILRQWLEYAGVLNPDDASSGAALWTPDEKRIKKLLGITAGDIEQWAELTKPQYDFARAFGLMATDVATSADVRDSAIALYGTEFPEGGLPQSVLHRLEEVGLIRWEKTTAGRGAKAHKVFATAKLRNEFLEPILNQLASTMGQGYKRLARMSLAEILTDLDCDNKHRKGIALEALAFYFCRRLDLAFVQWRLGTKSGRSSAAGIIARGTRCLRETWSISCRDCKRVTSGDVAVEVGLAIASRAQVLILIITGAVAPDAVKFAAKVMNNNPLRVVCINRSHLGKLRSGHITVLQLLRFLDPSVLACAA